MYKGSKTALAKGIFNFIWRQEIETDGGTFILTKPDKKHYFFSGTTHRLYELSFRNDDLAGYIWYRYGLLRSEQLMKLVLEHLHAYCNMRGLEREVRRFAHWSTRAQTLYLSRYNGTCWKLDGQYIDVVNNGEGVLFLDDDGGVPCEDPTIARSGKLLDWLVNGVQYLPTTQGGLTPDQQRLALGIWLFAVAFPDFLQAKPLLLVEGEAGSGKTTALQLIQATVHGRVETQSVAKDGERDFGVQMLRSPIFLLDNHDTFVDWLQDTLCQYATGGQWNRRKLYSDDDQTVIRPQSFIAITSRNPASFRRDDVADRCLVIRLERRTGFVPPSALFTQTMDDRPELFGEWLYYLNRIVAELRAGWAIKHAAQVAQRMADFAAIAHATGRVLGYSMDEVDDMLAAMASERDALVNENNTFVELLDHWLANRNNMLRPVTAIELNHELDDIAKRLSVVHKMSPNALAQRLTRGRAIRKRFVVEQPGIRGNARLYTIRRTES